MRLLIVVQARTGATRLPDKVLLPVAGVCPADEEDLATALPALLDDPAPCISATTIWSRPWSTASRLR